MFNVSINNDSALLDWAENFKTEKDALEWARNWGTGSYNILIDENNIPYSHYYINSNGDLMKEIYPGDWKKME